MEVIKPPKGGLVKAWVEGVEFEARAREQVYNVARLPFIHRHVAVMPDVHSGIGATVGTVIATHGAIIPAAVGVDIGCGMMAFRTGLRADDLPEDLRALRSAIESMVPVGRSDDGGRNDVGSWRGTPPEVVISEWLNSGLQDGYEEFLEEDPGARHRAPLSQLGTLGTGNHFIKVDLDEEGYVWVMLHSGSRGAGNRIGTYFIAKAKQEMERYFIHLPDRDLAYLAQGTENYARYRRALAWAQKYARINRELMMARVLFAFEQQGLVWDGIIHNTDILVQCHHNYVNEEHHFGKKVLVTRKGAIRAQAGDLGIIPGAMGVPSYIVRGKGNPDSFNSASHGAGRRMSRTAAKARFTVGDLEESLGGVESRRDAAVLDEIAGAYKDLSAVLAAEQDLVEVVHTLNPRLVVKG